MVPQLDVLMVSSGLRLENLSPEALPPVEGVRYKIACQTTADRLPNTAKLERSDIEIRFFDDRGISVNRNHSLDMAQAPAVLLADDDTFFDAEGLAAAARFFAENSDVDYAAFRCIMPGRNNYPPDGHDLSKPYRFYGPVSIELAFRPEVLRRHNLKFNELAGIGAPYLTAGEEDLLLYHCRKAGLRGRFCDISVVTHPQPSTGLKEGDSAGFLRAKGALMRLNRGFAGALIRLPLEATRARGNKMKALVYLSQGFVYSIVNRHKL